MTKHLTFPLLALLSLACAAQLPKSMASGAIERSGAEQGETAARILAQFPDAITSTKASVQLDRRPAVTLAAAAPLAQAVGRTTQRERDLELLVFVMRNGNALLLREGHELFGPTPHPAPYLLSFSLKALAHGLDVPVSFDAPEFWLAEDVRGLPVFTAEARAKLIERAEGEGWKP